MIEICILALVMINNYYIPRLHYNILLIYIKYINI